MNDNEQLPIPDIARSDVNSFEILRVWVADKGQHVSLRAGVWTDPAAWGLVLADLARHVSNCYQEDAQLDPIRTLRRIKAAFDVECTAPTDDPSGEIGQ